MIRITKHYKNTYENLVDKIIFKIKQNKVTHC